MALAAALGAGPAQAMREFPPVYRYSGRKLRRRKTPEDFKKLEEAALRRKRRGSKRYRDYRACVTCNPCDHRTLVGEESWAYLLGDAIRFAR